MRSKRGQATSGHSGPKGFAQMVPDCPFEPSAANVTLGTAHSWPQDQLDGVGWEGNERHIVALTLRVRRNLTRSVEVYYVQLTSRNH